MDYITHIHGVFGVIVGVSGVLQILLKKGGKWHRQIGTAYFYSWIIIVITGSLIGSPFIAILGALGLYMAYTGYRFARNKSSELPKIDQIVIYSGVCLSVALAVSGVVLWTMGASNLLVMICLLFGAIFFTSTFQDLRVFVLKKGKKRTSGHHLEWMIEHYGRMYISYIAAITAFCSIQNIFGIGYLNWTLPTVIGTALIIFTNRHYFKKLNIRKTS